MAIYIQFEVLYITFENSFKNRVSLIYVALKDKISKGVNCFYGHCKWSRTWMINVMCFFSMMLQRILNSPGGINNIRHTHKIKDKENESWVSHKIASDNTKDKPALALRLLVKWKIQRKGAITWMYESWTPTKLCKWKTKSKMFFYL